MADKHPDIYGCNHHHPIRDDEELVDFGTGRFVADKPLIPLLKALNEVGLVTRTHNFSADEHSFIGIIVPENMTVEFRTVTEPVANRDTFRGQREMLISWDARTLGQLDPVGSDERPNPWPLGGYAPGVYEGHCRDCGKRMLNVDKRATQCLECAVIAVKARTTAEMESVLAKNEIALSMRDSLDEELKVTKEFLAVSDTRLASAVSALRLFDEWSQMRTDRGGKDGPKGQAYARFVEAKDTALSDVPLPVAELNVKPRIVRDMPGLADSGGRVVVDFATDDEMRTILSVLARTTGDVQGATHRHKKRGTEYALLGFGKMQASMWRRLLSADNLVDWEAVDMREVAIYRSVDDGRLWVRPREEFEDGRFEDLREAGQ